MSQSFLEFGEAGVLRSTQFNDVYFSVENGLEESRYVFLEGNQLPARWQENLCNFTIIETGFGTGLNFFAAWQAWQDRAMANQTLHFISCEKYPLSANQIEQALAYWPELTPLVECFIAFYSPASGVREYRFDMGKCSILLSLYVMDIREALADIKARNIKANAWFLDGFAPKVNPDMWSENLYHTMGICTDSQGTCATFTAAGHVRRGLQSAGFRIEKRKGFGWKREMVFGTYHT